MFNWLFARRTGGTFVLRIEDTDTERNREEWVEGIFSSLAWLGLDADEGPYRQSERTGAYGAAVDQLWAAGMLYACGCSREEVESRTKGNAIPGYDGHCRELGLPREGRALRFRVPDAGNVVVKDVIRGEVDFPCEAIEDFVLVKSSGSPLFVLANVVDDIDMSITHVIRGEDLLPSTPKGLLVWKALRGEDAELPVFAHLPMLVNERRQKLSKRRDPVALESYREQGYLPQAMVNYLALLGWSHPDGHEMMQVGEILESFRLEDVNHSPAFFDVAKLTHLNGEHLRKLDREAFVEACSPWLTTERAPWPSDRFDAGRFRRIAPLVQERVATLAEVPGMVDFLFLDQPVIDDDAWRALTQDPGEAMVSAAMLTGVLEAVESCDWSAATLHDATLRVGESLGRKLGRAQAPVRVAITGRRVGPPLFESMELLGRDVVQARLKAALSLIGAEARPSTGAEAASAEGDPSRAGEVSAGNPEVSAGNPERSAGTG